jgi:hypothetical protein
LVDCCRTIAPAIDAEGVAERLMQAVAKWSTGTEQFDDTTVVVVSVVASWPKQEIVVPGTPPANDVAVTALPDLLHSSRRAPMIPAFRANETERAV